jgi:hypothetical protein
LTSETSKPSNIISFESQELSADSLNDADKDAINMLFMLHESIILRDGKGITQEVTYLGPEYLDKILRHKVWNRNGHKFLVDGTLLSSMDVPHISTIPVSVDQYKNEHLLFVAQIANDFEQINGIFDNTINGICHQVQA